MAAVHMISVRHNFETAHRLPHLGGKCKNLHGHSWWAEVTVASPTLSERGTLTEFGAFKAAMRAWIDLNLDHGLMLGHADPLLPALRADGTKLFIFGQDWGGAQWPTVEAVATMLADHAAGWIGQDAPPGARIARVRVSETHVNAAEWAADAPQPPAIPSIGDLWHHAVQSFRESA